MKQILKYSWQIINKTISAPGLYYEGDVYVYLSRLDGIGLTVAESIAAGMPILVPDDAPMNEFAIDKKINTFLYVNCIFST